MPHLVGRDKVKLLDNHDVAESLIRINSAGIAQLVERNLAKVEVAGSSPVSRSR